MAVYCYVGRKNHGRCLRGGGGGGGGDDENGKENIQH